MAVCTNTVIMNSQSLKEGKDAENDRNELETEFETLLKQQNSYVVFVNQHNLVSVFYFTGQKLY